MSIHEHECTGAGPEDQFRAIRIGSIEICPRARTVSVEGVVANVGTRAFDLMMVLIEGNGGIVPKAEILRRVWSTVTVVDNNLKVQLCGLRRALGRERWRIRTITGKGYLLIRDSAVPAQGEALPSAPASGLQIPLTIVVETSVDRKERLMQAIQDVAASFDGSARLAPSSDQIPLKR